MNADYLQQSKDKNIKRIISTNGLLKQLIEKPTRVTKDSSTLIDIIATSHEQNILKTMTFANSISDHDLVGMIMKKNNRKFKPRTIYTRNFAKYNEANYKADLRHLDWKNITQESDVNKAWDIFKSLWKSVIDKHAPLIKKRVRGRESPWFTNEIKIKAHERDYYLSCKVFNVDGKRSSNVKEIANGFCKFFTNIGKNLQNVLPKLTDIAWTHHDHSNSKRKLNPQNCTFTFQRVSSKEIKDIMRKLNRKKAQGYDEIPTSFIKDGADILADPLACLINRCLANSRFPSAGKCSKVIPVYKSEERSLLDNYRPISILPVLSKVFERVVHQQLYTYLEENNLLSKNQFRFRTSSSTQHAVTKFSDSIRQNMDKGLMTGAIFIDLRKAFDTVDHASLLSKLTIYGIRNEELMWFEDYLFNRTQFVAFEGAVSSIQPISCGVPQGSILGLLLFTLLINDIDIHLKWCEIIMYADDIVIYYANKLVRESKNTLIMT